MAEPKRWALLIGVNFYIKNPETKRHASFSDLSGCVRDVLAIEDYLCQMRTPVTIRKLTASQGNNGTPKEEEKDWPTYKNIVKELDNINKYASPGDLVYIHYSGHGIRRDSKLPADGGDNVSGTALAPMDVMAEGAYLTGSKLGEIIKSMVERKRLRVTLVLDSCFSGRGLRTATGDLMAIGDMIRTSPDEIDESQLQSDIDASNSEFRNASDETSWLAKPTSCTVLTACGIFETASERYFDNSGNKHGVLTYWLLNFLKRNPKAPPPSYARLYDHIQAGMITSQPPVSQTPVIHGDEDYEFFGNKQITRKPVCHVIGKREDKWFLDVGRAQAVSLGSKYDVFPETWDIGWGQPIDNSGIPRSELPPQLSVTKIYDFRSEAILLPREEGFSEDMAVKVGSRAIPRTLATEEKVYVTFAYPSKGMDEEFKISLEATIRNSKILHLRTNDADPRETFRISAENPPYFVILDGEGLPLSRIPQIPLDDKQKTEKLIHVLLHLSRFREIERLKNYNLYTSLKPKSFSFDLLDEELTLLSKNPSGGYDVEHEDIVNISFVNNSQFESVHVTILELNATWGIKKLHAEETFEGYPVKRRLRMRIPPPTSPHDPADINDTYRAIVCAGTRIPSWDAIQLPDITLDKDRSNWFRNADDDVDTSNIQATRTTLWQFLDLVIHTSPRKTNINA
jgi:hypothetical protein